MSYHNGTERNQGAVKAVTTVVIVLVALLLVFLLISIRVVDVSKSCAWVRMGKVIGEADSGFQLVNPLNTKACFPGQSVLYQTAADVTGDGKVDSEADYDNFPVEIKTSDGQSAMVEFNLKFHVEPECAPIIRTDIASNTDDLVMRVVDSLSRSVPRDLAPEFSATELYGQDRVVYEEYIHTTLTPLFEKNCVVLDEFFLRDINFDPAYESIMEQKQIQMENVSVQKFIADQAVENARATVTNAAAQADAQIETARGQAETVRLLAIAEAESMRIRGEALQDFPEMLDLKFFDALTTANWSLIPWDSVAGYLPINP